MKTLIISSLIVSTLALGSVAAMAAAGEPAMMGPTSMGQAWVNTKGMTLYSFDKDTAGKSTCVDACAVAWPPLMAEKDSKASGKWTLVARADGTSMWAYDGHPLYTFAMDKKAGDVTGDNVNGFHIAK